MDHAITLWDVALWLGIPFILCVFGALLVGIIALLNPFRSGH